VGAEGLVTISDRARVVYEGCFLCYYAGGVRRVKDVGVDRRRTREKEPHGEAFSAL
jgi:hypothetical protein